MDIDRTAEHAGRLRAAGLRVTQQRLTVLAALAELPHADVDTIATAARQKLGALSTQAVYDILKALTDSGLARRIEPAGQPSRFETRVGDNHHHVVCRQCGATAESTVPSATRPVSPRPTSRMASSSTRPRSCSGVSARTASRPKPNEGISHER